MVAAESEALGWGRSVRARWMSASSSAAKERPTSLETAARVAFASPPHFFTFVRLDNYMNSIGGLYPTSLDKQVSQCHILACRPECASFHKLMRVDQVCVQGQHAKQKIAVSIHKSMFPRSR